MKTRSTRILLLAVLFLALAPGATLAVCLQEGPSPCCCPDTDCPEPGEARIDSGSCCEMSKRSPLPTTPPNTVMPAPARPLDEAGDEVDTFETTLVSVSTFQEVKPTNGLPSPVPLFTLHAALLI